MQTLFEQQRGKTAVTVTTAVTLFDNSVLADGHVSHLFAHITLTNQIKQLRTL